MTTLSIGPLTLVGEQAGAHVHITVLGAGLPGQRPHCGKFTVTTAEWLALEATASVMLVDAKCVAALEQARAENDVLKQEVRELEQQRDAARSEARGAAAVRDTAVRLYDHVGEKLEQVVGGDGTSAERLQRLVTERDAARTELRDVLVIKQQLTEERDTAVAQLAGFRVLFEEQGRALTAARASVASQRERVDQYMPIDSVLGDWQWSQIVEDGCIDDVALMRAAEALAYIEREQKKAREGKAARNG